MSIKIKKSSIEYSIISWLMIFTINTKLRFHFVGVHDILFFVFFAYQLIKRRKVKFFNMLLTFIVVIAITMLYNILFNDYISGTFLHDASAIVYILVFIASFITLEIDRSRFLHIVYWNAIIYLVVISCFAFIGKESFLWYGGYACRLSGLSKNPNQFSLLLLMQFLLSLYFYNIYKKRRYLFALLFILCLIFFNRSDALLLSVLTFFVVYLALTYRIKMFFVVIFLIFLFHKEILDLAMNIYYSGGQGNERLTRWMTFVHLVPQVLFIGYGIGSHGPSFQDTFKGVPGKVFQNTEFHNSILDISSQIGVLFTLFILSVYLYKVLKTRSIYCISLIMSLFVFIQFHYTFRQPLFYFMLMLPFIYVEDRKVYVRKNIIKYS